MTSSARDSPLLPRSDLVSASDMTSSARDEDDHGRQHDNIYRKHEQRRMPDMAQQVEVGRDPARRDCNKPCSDHQQRDRRNVNTVHIDIKEPQIDSPPSK